MDNKEFVWTDELVKEVLELRKNYGKGFPNEHIINYFKKSKEKKPLFTTVDGVDIFDDEAIIYYLDKENFCVKERYAKQFTTDIPYYSHLDELQEYILMNKPCISVNDFVLLWNSDKVMESPLIKDIIKLAKQKINNV